MQNLSRNIIFSFFFLFPVILYAQQPAVQTNQEEKIQFVKKANPGTYQFIVSEPDSQFIFTNDILVQIENRRKEKEEVIFPVNAFVKVRVLSRSEIMDDGFKPVEEIIYTEQ
jgi:hypothetical protein